MNWSMSMILRAFSVERLCQPGKHIDIDKILIPWWSTCSKMFNKYFTTLKFSPTVQTYLFRKLYWMYGNPGHFNSKIRLLWNPLNPADRDFEERPLISHRPRYGRQSWWIPHELCWKHDNDDHHLSRHARSSWEQMPSPQIVFRANPRPVRIGLFFHLLQYN